MRLATRLLTLSAFVVAGAPACSQEAAALSDKPSASAEAFDIVVTATKREIRLSEAPVSVTLVNEAELDNVFARDLSDLSDLVPSLRTATFANTASTNFIIRGVGNGAFNPGIEPSIGIFVDGIYRSRAPSALFDLPPIERVEVLRGPQSALFGKNASAGVISIITKAPEFQLAGSTQFTLSNFDGKIAEFDLTGPFQSDLAFRVSGGLSTRDGYGRAPNLDTRVNDRDRTWLRAQLAYSPNPGLKIRLVADHDEIDENCCLVTNVSEGPTTALIRMLGGEIGTGAAFSDTYFVNFQSRNKLENNGISLEITRAAETFSITSLTAFRDNDTHADQDSDFTSADLLGRNAESRHTETFTQELRVEAALGENIELLVGGFFLRETLHQENELRFGTQFRDYASGLIASMTGGQVTTSQLEALSLGSSGIGSFWRSGQGTHERYRLKNTAFSLFASTDIQLTDRLRLTFGVAYNDDKKSSEIDIKSSDLFSAVDLISVGRNALVSSAIGEALGLGRPATLSEIENFMQLQPASFAAIDEFAGINAGVLPTQAATDDNPLTSVGNPLLSLRDFQFLPPFLNYPNAIEDGKTHDSDWSWSAAIAYELNDAVSLHARYATGFKASSINLSRDSRPFVEDFIPGSPSQIPPPEPSPIRSAGLAAVNLTSGTRFARPEHSEVWEAGMRAQWHGGSANLSWFAQEIHDFQTLLFLGTGFALGNAERQSIKGIEFDGSVRVNQNLLLNAAFTRLTAKYDRFENAQIADSQVVSYSGMKVAGVPTFSARVGIGYSRKIAQIGSIHAHAQFTYSSPVRIRQDYPEYKRKTSKVDASISWQSRNRNMEISLWGRNIFNNRWLVQVFPGVLQPGTVSGYPNQPRTYGSRIRFLF